LVRYNRAVAAATTEIKYKGRSPRRTPLHA
jgi:hypothetical protein